MSERTNLISKILGVAEYSYEPLTKDGKAYFIVNSEASNKEQPLNLFFNHDFLSKSLSKDENDKIISDLTSTLKSVNASNIKTSIRQNTPIAQTILVSYNIANVEQSKVDELTTTIASVSKKIIDGISASPSDVPECGPNQVLISNFNGSSCFGTQGGPCPCNPNANPVLYCIGTCQP
jgi:hypothetical protein